MSQKCQYIEKTSSGSIAERNNIYPKIDTGRLGES